MRSHALSGGSSVRSYAIFDVGSSSVGAALALATDDGVEILWSTRVQFGYESALEYSRYLRAMYAAFLDTGMTLTSEGLRAAKTNRSFDIKHLTCSTVLGSPWFFGAVRSGTRRRDAPFQVTHGVLDEEQGKLYASLIKDTDSASWRTVMGEPELLELQPTLIKVNGYPMPFPIGHSAYELDVTSYVALVAQPVAEQIRTMMQRIFPNHDTRIVSSSKALAGLRSVIHASDVRRAVIIDVGGQITSMVLVDQGIMLGAQSVASGTDPFLMAVAPKALGYAEARSAWDLAVKDVSPDAPAEESLPEVVEGAAHAWIEQVHEGMRTLMRGITPPHHILLIASDAFYGVLSRVLARPWMQPGIREAHGAAVIRFRLDEPNAPGAKLGTKQDGRLHLLALAVDDASRRG